MYVTFSGDVFTVQVFGGISRYYAELHKGLLSFGVRSRILAGFHVNSYIGELPHVLGIRTPTRGSRARRVANDLLERAWFAVDRKTTIYHKTYFSGGLPPPHVPVVVTVYDMIHEKFPHYFRDDDATPRLKRDWCSRADLVLAISTSTKNDITTILGMPEEKVKVTLLGTNPARNYCFDRSRSFLLYVGERKGYKNFDRFLAAYKAIRPSVRPRLVCFGGGSPNSEELEYLNKESLGGHVTFVSGSDALLSRYYGDAIALACPSLYEGFGLPVLEAMAHGCPVVCSETSSLPEVVGAAAVFFDPEDIDSMTAAIERILVDDGLRQKVAEAGIKRSRELTWQKTTAETLGAYKTLCW